MRGRGQLIAQGAERWAREEMAAGFLPSGFLHGKEKAQQLEQCGPEVPLESAAGLGGDAPLRVRFVLPVPGMPNHSALPNDGIRTGYPHAFKHQPVKSKYIKHP